MPQSPPVRCKLSSLVLFGSLTLVACVPPKAIVADQSLLPADAQPPPNPRTAAAATPSSVEGTASNPVEPVIPVAPVNRPGDDLKLPDMLALPGEGEFRATNPSSPRRNPEVGPVISRPPTDPPPRPKPTGEKQPE